MSRELGQLATFAPKRPQLGSCRLAPAPRLLEERPRPRRQLASTVCLWLLKPSAALPKFQGLQPKVRSLGAEGFRLRRDDTRNSRFSLDFWARSRA